MRTSMNLIFGTTTGNSYTVRVPNALDTTNLSLIRNSMDMIIEANTVDTNKRGDLSSRTLARLIKVSEVDFDVS